MMEPVGCHETPVTNYQSKLRQIPKERRSHLLQFHHTYPQLHSMLKKLNLVSFIIILCLGSPRCLATMTLPSHYLCCYRKIFVQTMKIFCAILLSPCILPRNSVHGSSLLMRGSVLACHVMLFLFLFLCSPITLQQLG
jgi:hypothetical protein